MFKSRSWRGVLDTTLCDKVCQWLATGQWFSAGTLVSSTNKTDRHNWNIQTKSNLYMTANKHNLNACSFQLQLIHYQDFLHLKIRKQSRIYKLLNFDLHIDEVELQLHEEAVVAVIVCTCIYNCLCNQCLSPLKLWVLRTPLRRGVLDTTLCDKVCQWLAAGRWFSPGTQVSSTNKTDCHNLTEILLKVALITKFINP